MAAGWVRGKAALPGDGSSLRVRVWHRAVSQCGDTRMQVASDLLTPYGRPKVRRQFGVSMHVLCGC